MKSVCFLCNTELGMFSTKYKKSELGREPPREMSDGDVICEKCYKEAVQRGEKPRKEFEDKAKQDKSERFTELQKRISQYKPMWDKGGVIQFKNERIAILQRRFGAQVEFIIAFDDLTAQGYELKAIDEGKTAEGQGLTGGVNSYYYFQKKEFVR